MAALEPAPSFVETPLEEELEPEISEGAAMLCLGDHQASSAIVWHPSRWATWISEGRRAAPHAGHRHHVPSGGLVAAAACGSIEWISTGIALAFLLLLFVVDVVDLAVGAPALPR